MLSEDTEITLGVGRLVGLFFLLAAICGVFFSVGYSLGKSNAREQTLDEPPAQVQPASTASPEPSDAKPPAVVTTKSDAAQTPQEQASAANIKNNLTFYKAVQQGANGTPVPTNENPAPTLPAAAKQPVTNVAQSTPPALDTTSPSATPPTSHAAPVTGAGTIVVQIAAITREDDAVALAGALRKKDYNVIVVKNPAVNDKFYHVQVGPFTSMKEADAMKTKLIAEGYNPIVKR